jgi:hypothetical protein
LDRRRKCVRPRFRRPRFRRPRFRRFIGILLLALEDPLSCALSFFQSTREYVSGKAQAGTQQILLLIGLIMLRRKDLLLPYPRLRTGVLVICSQNAFGIWSNLLELPFDRNLKNNHHTARPLRASFAHITPLNGWPFSIRNLLLEPLL